MIFSTSLDRHRPARGSKGSRPRASDQPVRKPNEIRCDFSRQSGKIDRLITRLNASGLDTREVE